MTELMEQLVRTENMTPRDAYAFAPHYQEHRRPVVNGEYAQLATAKGLVYYKRVNDVWKLDETCSGPYPCTSNEPTCTVTDTDCVDVSFRLKQNLVQSILVDYQLGMYKNKATYDMFLQAREKQLIYQLQAKKRVHTQKTLVYNNRLYAMGKSVVKVEQSPKTPLLFLILEKPLEDRYTELSHFIKTFTRGAHETEDGNWLYCASSGLKLLPRVFKEVIQGYEEKQYEDVLERLEFQGQLQVVDGNRFTVTGGFPVASMEFEQMFDDVMRSTELVKEAIFQLKRTDNPLTPFVVELLNTISIQIKVDVTFYYNFMIDKMLSIQAPLLVQSIAFVLKIAQMESNIVVDDKLAELFSRQSRLFQPIFTRFKQTFEPFEVKDIQREIKNVSTYYEIKQLGQIEHRKTAGIEKTTSTVWNTFLPPTKITVNTTASPHNTAMMILQLIQRQVIHKPTLREGLFRQNTVMEPFVPEEAKHLMKQWVYRLPTYHRNIRFIPVSTPLPYDDKVTRTELSGTPVDPTVIVPDLRDFGRLIPPLIQSLSVDRFNVDFIAEKPMPLVYLQTLIRNIGRLFPSFLLHHPTQYRDNAVPIPFEKNVLSRNHLIELAQLANKTIFASLHKIPGTGIGLEALLQDTTIDDMIAQFQVPTELDRRKYEFYIYTLFRKYITGCPEEHRTIVLSILGKYRDFVIQDRQQIFIDMDAVHAHLLTVKAIESNKRRLKLNTLSTGDRFVFNFRQMANIDKESRIGRSREYNPEQHDMETDLFNTGAEDNDRGGDGNEEDGEMN
jgi:hypothetical protein